MHIRLMNLPPSYCVSGSCALLQMGRNTNIVTHQNFNIEPQNGGLEDEIPFERVSM